MKVMQFFKILNINFKKIYFIYFFVTFFYKIWIELTSIFDLIKIIYWKLWRHLTSILLPTINNISISVKRSDFNLVFLKDVCYGNSGAERNFARSSSYISRKIFWKFTNTSAKNNVLPWTYNSWYSLKFFIWKSLETFFVCV